MPFVPLEQEYNLDLKNYTIILPGVGMGNVGGLSTDLILANAISSPSSDKPKLVGYYYDSKVMSPFIGQNLLSISSSSTNDMLHFAIELYIDDINKIAILQQRTSPKSKKRREFTRDYIRWITDHSPRQILILTSTSGKHRDDVELSSKQTIQFFTVESECREPCQDDLSMVERFQQLRLDTASATKESNNKALIDILIADVPPKKAYTTPLASILSSHLPPTRYSPDDYADHKKIKHIGHTQVLYSDHDPLLSPSTQKNKRDNDDDMNDKDDRKKDDDSDDSDDSDDDDDDEVDINPHDDDHIHDGDNTKKKKKLIYEYEPFYFPFDIKGGGITRSLAKRCRKYNIPLAGIVALPLGGDIRPLVHSVANKSLQIISQLVSSGSKNDDNTTTLYGLNSSHLQSPVVWDQAYSLFGL